MKQALFLVTAALLPLSALLAQNDLLLLGRLDDINRLSPQDNQHHEFTFVRLIYDGRILGYYKNWYTDYPRGETHLIDVFKRLTSVDVSPEGRAIPIQDIDLFNYPFIYSVEGGQMMFSVNDARILREYLDRGGFWMVDDFWGTLEWNHFVSQMQKVFPEFDIVNVPRDHPIFHTMFDIDKLVQIPNSSYASCLESCVTWEQDGFEPQAKGVFDANGRLIIFINHNTDLMDAVEWSDEPRYPQYFSAHSYKMFTNVLVYSMTH